MLDWQQLLQSEGLADRLPYCHNAWLTAALSVRILDSQPPSVKSLADSFTFSKKILPDILSYSQNTQLRLSLTVKMIGWEPCLQSKLWLIPYYVMSRVSSGSIVSDYGLDDRAIMVRSPAEAKDFSSNLCVQTGSEAYPMSTGVLSPGVKRGQGVMLTIHPHLEPRSWMNRSYTPLPPSASMACSGTALLFTFTLLCRKGGFLVPLLEEKYLA
jgi:hypothetical protein